MTFKKKPPKEALAKLRDGTTLLAPIQDIINSALQDGANDPTLEDYEAVGGDLNNLKGEALYAYLDLQTGRQQRQINNNNTELQETINRISELLNAHGFLATLQVDDPKLERQATFFRIIAECQGKEEDLKTNVAEYIDCHATKAKHQYEAMKEIEQWFLDLLADKSMEQEFNDELAHIKFRHEEQAAGQQNIEDALAKVQMTVQKLRDIGSILILSTSEGVSVFEGPPPDRDDTVTLLVPTDSGSDVRFHFTVILDDEAMFRDPKVQLLAQQYLKGMIFYGSAAKHKNRAQKRKVIRLMMRQLEAIYNLMTRLRNAMTVAEKENIGYKIRVDELQLQKDQAYRDRERYRSQVDDADTILKKAVDEKEALRLVNVLLEDKVKQADRDLENCKAAAVVNAAAMDGRHSIKEQQEPTGSVAVSRPPGIDSVTSMPAEMTAEKEVQVGNQNIISHSSRAVPVQHSLIEVIDVEAQPSFDGLTSDERIELEGAKEQVVTCQDTVVKLTGELDDLKAAHEALERRASQLVILVKQGEARRVIEEAVLEKVRQTAAKAEEEKQEFLGKQHAMEEEVQAKLSTIRELQTLTASQNLIIHSRDHQTQEEVTTTESDIFGNTVQCQTDEITPSDVKVELQKLKSGLADFRRAMIGVLVAQNLIADIPSFPEQLRDTWNTSSAAGEITKDVMEHFGRLINIISTGFEKLNSNHKKAFQMVLSKKAAEIEGRLHGVDSSEEMRKVRLKLHQRVLDLEVENSQMHDTLRTLTKLIEEHRSDYESQLVQKDEKVLKQREDNRRMKDLAWSLAENLAKLRDEAVSKMPERKSLTDMMQLLQMVEQRLGRKIRTSEEATKTIPQLLVQGMPLTDPTANPLKLPPKTSRFDLNESRVSLQEVPTGVFGQHIARQTWSPVEESPMTRDKRTSPIRGLLDIVAATKGTSTADRIARSALEYTRYFIDPADGWTIRSSTYEVLQMEKSVQTGIGAKQSEDGLISGGLFQDTKQTATRKVALDEHGDDYDGSAVMDQVPQRDRASVSRPAGKRRKSRPSKDKVAPFTGDQSGRLKGLPDSRGYRIDQVDRKDDNAFHKYGPIGGVPRSQVKVATDQPISSPPALGSTCTPDLLDPNTSQTAGGLPLGVGQEVENQPMDTRFPQGQYQYVAYRSSPPKVLSGSVYPRGESDQLRLGQMTNRVSPGEAPREFRVDDTAANLIRDPSDPTHLHPAHPSHGLDWHDPTGASAVSHIRGAVRTYFRGDDSGRDTGLIDTRPGMPGGVFAREHGGADRQTADGGLYSVTLSAAHGSAWRQDNQGNIQLDGLASTQLSPTGRGGGSHTQHVPRRIVNPGQITPCTGPDRSPTTFGSPSAAGNQPTYHTYPFIPQEQAEAARQASDHADAILSDMECNAAQQVDKIRRSRLASSPSSSPTSSFVPSSSPESAAASASPASVLSPQTAGKLDLTTGSPTALGAEETRTEAYYLQQLVKLRQARIHVSEVRHRLATLENEAAFHASQTVAPDNTETGDPEYSHTPIPSPEMAKEALEALRKEAKIIKGDIKVLQRGHKAMSRRRSRSPEVDDPQALLAKFAITRKIELNREQQIAGSKSTRRKKMEGFDQAITKFVQHGPGWQKAIDAIEEKADGSEAPIKPGQVTIDSQALIKDKLPGQLPVRPKTAAGHEAATVRLVQKPETSVDMAATGVGLNTPNSPRPATATTNETCLYPSEILHLNAPVKRKQPSVPELLDGSITRKLKYLREQRLEQSPRHIEKQQKNPVIRTHRGEEPFEGPVDMAPYNFPDLGVIGRPVPQKLAKESQLLWDQDRCLPQEEANERSMSRMDPATAGAAVKSAAASQERRKIKKATPLQTAPIQTMTMNFDSTRL